MCQLNRQQFENIIIINTVIKKTLLMMKYIIINSSIIIIIIFSNCCLLATFHYTNSRGSLDLKWECFLGWKKNTC